MTTTKYKITRAIGAGSLVTYENGTGYQLLPFSHMSEIDKEWILLALTYALNRSSRAGSATRNDTYSRVYYVHHVDYDMRLVYMMYTHIEHVEIFIIKVFPLNDDGEGVFHILGPEKTDEWKVILLDKNGKIIVPRRNDAKAQIHNGGKTERRKS